LPANLFDGITIPATVLLFRQEKRDGKGLFIEASREIENGKNQNRLLSAHIEKVNTLIGPAKRKT
jgi:type I restriction enzyme M protein